MSTPEGTIHEMPKGYSGKLDINLLPGKRDILYSCIKKTDFAEIIFYQKKAIDNLGNKVKICANSKRNGASRCFASGEPVFVEEIVNNSLGLETGLYARCEYKEKD